MFEEDKLKFLSMESREDVIILYDKLVEDNGFDTYFYNVKQKDFSAEKFIDMLNGKVITAALYDKRVAAFMILEPIFYNHAGSISYYGYSWVRGKYSIGIGKAYLDGMLNNFNTLVGLSPANNRLSIKFNRAIGMKKLGAIHEACYIAKDDIYVDGILTTITT